MSHYTLFKGGWGGGAGRGFDGGCIVKLALMLCFPFGFVSSLFVLSMYILCNISSRLNSRLNLINAVLILSNISSRLNSN